MLKVLRIEVTNLNGEEFSESNEGWTLEHACEEADFMADGGEWYIMEDTLDEEEYEVVYSEQVADSETYRSRNQ